MPLLKGVAEEAIRLRVEHPEYTLQRIGDELGVTRERVRQLLKKHGQPTWSARKYNYCPTCETRIEPKAIQCSQCYKESCHIQVVCNFCDTTKVIRLSDHKRNTGEYPSNSAYTGKFYCGKGCFGKWFGKTHGWGVQKALRTHCKYGHEYTEENIKKYPSKGEIRHCKTCISNKKEASSKEPTP